MNEIIRHEKYRELCKDIYPQNLKNFPKDVVPLYVHENKNNGFFAYACKYKDRIVIVFRGTELKTFNDDITDGRNDINMGFLDNIPDQAHDAILFTKQIKQVMKTKYPNYKLDLTGHSLGGSLAQYTHVLVKGINETVTFNPYGTRKTLEKYFENNTSQSPTDKITNYCVPWDPIAGLYEPRNQIGNKYKIGTTNIVKAHHLEHMKALDTNKKTEGIKKNFYNTVSKCPGFYKVQGYVKSNGTKVREYIRTCGKHNKMSMEERIKGQAKYKGKRFQDIPLDELEEAIGYFV